MNIKTSGVTESDDTVRDDTDLLDTKIQEGQDREDRSEDNADARRYYLRNRGGSQSAATLPGETREVTYRQTVSVDEGGNSSDQGQFCSISSDHYQVDGTRTQ